MAHLTTITYATSRFAGRAKSFSFITLIFLDFFPPSLNASLKVWPIPYWAYTIEKKVKKEPSNYTPCKKEILYAERDPYQQPWQERGKTLAIQALLAQQLAQFASKGSHEGFFQKEPF